MPGVTAYRSLSMKALRLRGVTDEQLHALGGDIQKHNVIFAAGEPYDRAADLLNLPPMPQRPVKLIDTLDDDERAIYNEIGKQPEGLGDTLKGLFEKIGADKAAALYTKLTGKACGCEGRRKWLNKWWPYKH